MMESIPPFETVLERSKQVTEGKLPAQILIAYTLEFGSWHGKNLQELFATLVDQYGAKAACAKLGKCDTAHWVQTGKCRYL